jgi:hypothetical protein
MEIIKQKHVFTGGMNMDDDLRFIKPGDYRYAINCRIGSSEDENRGVVENIKGNELVNASLPGGVNVCIGTYEDRAGGSVFYFIHNSSLNHGIYRYFVASNTVEKIFEGSILNFDSTYLITSVELVDDMLYWCDGLNPSRKLNITDCSSYPTPYIEEFINHAKNPPLIAPIIATADDVTKPYLLGKKTYSFSYRYIYKDSEKSTFSPFSLAVPTCFPDPDTGGEVNTVYIYLSNNEDITDTGGAGSVNRYSSIIEEIEVIFKDTQNGSWRLFGRFPFEDVVADPRLEFYNDGSYPVIDQAEVSKLNDAVPLRPKTLSFVKGRMFLGNYYEGFDKYTLDVTRDADTYTALDNSYLYNKLLKPGSTYQFGVVFKDALGRRSGVYTSDDLKVIIPFEYNTNRVGISFTLNGHPPEWAHSYEIVRSDNLTITNFIQGHVDYVHFAAYYNANDEPIYGGPGNWNGNENSFNPSPADEVHISLRNWVRYHNISYTFSEGDRIRILTQGWSTFTSTFTSQADQLYVDQPIKKIYNSPVAGVGEVVVIDYPAGANILNRGAFVEIYSPRPNDSQVLYYETGRSYPVTDPGTPSRAFSTAAISISEGDCYCINKEFKITNFSNSYDTVTTRFISMNPDHEKLNTVWESGLGQPNTILDLEREMYKPTAIRFSNNYIQGSLINGLSSYEALNEEILPYEYGPICRLQVAGNNAQQANVLLSIHEREVVSNYIGQALFSDMADQTTVAISNKIIGASRALAGSFGSIHPESIVQHDGRVYGVDLLKGIIWRYAQDGLTPISNIFMKNFFYDKSRTLLPFKDTTRIPATFHPYFNEYIITIGSETVAFSEPLNRWVTFYSFVPEFYQKVGTRIVSFFNGAIYLHEGSNTYNNFYNVQFASQLKIATNQYPDVPKIYHNQAVMPNLWYASLMETQSGQITSLLSSDYEEKEGVHYAAIMRDLNSVGLKPYQSPLISGDFMRGPYMITTLETISTSKAQIFEAAVGFSLSSGHKL